VFSEIGDMEPIIQPQTNNKVDITAIGQNPLPSLKNTVIWSPVWEANLILEGKTPLVGNLYHGAIDSAYDHDGLRTHNITHIVHCDVYFKPKFLHEFYYLECSIDDEGGKELFYVLERAIPFIKKGLQKGNVLVHCAAGISRSSSIIIGYLLAEHRDELKFTSVEECNNFLVTKRDIAQPQLGYIKCLREFQQSEYNLNSQIILDSIGKTPIPPITLHKKDKGKKILGIF